MWTSDYSPYEYSVEINGKRSEGKVSETGINKIGENIWFDIVFGFVPPEKNWTGIPTNTSELAPIVFDGNITFISGGYKTIYEFQGKVWRTEGDSTIHQEITVKFIPPRVPIQ
ncbi:MAG: hypothetical protein R2747_00330 [Pyrinomonadaceae bacterium]